MGTQNQFPFPSSLWLFVSSAFIAIRAEATAPSPACHACELSVFQLHKRLPSGCFHLSILYASTAVPSQLSSLALLRRTKGDALGLCDYLNDVILLSEAFGCCQAEEIKLSQGRCKAVSGHGKDA